MLMMAESSSRRDPRSAKEKGEPGRKELLRSPSNFSEGRSTSRCSAVTGERDARSRFMSFLSFLTEGDVPFDCAGADDVEAWGIGAGAGALLRDELLEPLFFDLEEDLCFDFSARTSSSDGRGGSTSRYVVLGRGNVSLAFLSEDVNSDFSQKLEESMPYKESSFFSSESFIEEISGRSGMMEGVKMEIAVALLWILGLGMVALAACSLCSCK
mmetsp:Transcript_1151/g.2022  ORF Transcript_1151/g.2022 Transcript_1151/m.2022 type:complete len:213 (-) Transcript_1151:6-644(-)